MTRQETNRQILDLISIAVERYPDFRFHQILQNMKVEQPGQDQWYEESEETLRNIKRDSNI